MSSCIDYTYLIFRGIAALALNVASELIYDLVVEWRIYTRARLVGSW
jgi:hypothetical protein